MLTLTSDKLKSELASELENITHFWKSYSLDEVNGGFVGRRNHENIEDTKANKGIILNTRILWTFSAIGNYKKDSSTLKYAKRAFEYLQQNYQDHEMGGVYWELDAKGNPVNRRKQIYAQAFAVYALSEYFILTKDESALNWAYAIFLLIEKHAYDNEKEGYIEAFDQNWKAIEDMRLSEKDLNASKTMNTHLHILEAYTTLFSVSGSTLVKKALENLIQLFLNRFYNAKNQHFRLFFNDNWKHLDQKISYGHDIEAFWLLIEAAKSINNKSLLNEIENIGQSIADTFLKEAYIQNEGIINEIDLATNQMDTDRHWWPQAEAMVGLLYVYRITEDGKYLNALKDIWKYIDANIIDYKSGEWFFRVDENHKPYTNEDKIGMWKCPYHNSRALIILLNNLP